MSRGLPDPERALPPQKVAPQDPAVSPKRWHRFVVVLDRLLGRTPHFAERAVAAQVDRVETDSYVKRLAAEAEFERVKAEARSIELGAVGQHAKDIAAAHLTLAKADARQAETEAVRAKRDKWVGLILRADTLDGETAEAFLQETIALIRALEGDVRIDQPTDTEKPEEDESAGC